MPRNYYIFLKEQISMEQLIIIYLKNEFKNKTNLVRV